MDTYDMQVARIREAMERMRTSLDGQHDRIQTILNDHADRIQAITNGGHTMEDIFNSVAYGLGWIVIIALAVTIAVFVIRFIIMCIQNDDKVDKLDMAGRAETGAIWKRLQAIERPGDRDGYPSIVERVAKLEAIIAADEVKA